MGSRLRPRNLLQRRGDALFSRRSFRRHVFRPSGGQIRTPADDDGVRLRRRYLRRQRLMGSGYDFVRRDPLHSRRRLRRNVRVCQSEAGNVLREEKIHPSHLRLGMDVRKPHIAIDRLSASDMEVKFV